MDDDTQVDEEGLSRLVTLFYARVREDAELGPIFNDAIADWPEHLEKLAAFWSSVLLTSGRYKGQPAKAKRIAESLQLAMFFRLDRQRAEGSAINSDTMDYPRRRVRSHA